VHQENPIQTMEWAWLLGPREGAVQPVEVELSAIIASSVQLLQRWQLAPTDSQK